MTQVRAYIRPALTTIGAVDVRVMSANIYEGWADAHHRVRSARAKADIVQPRLERLALKCPRT